MPTVLHVISGLKVGGAEMALLRLIRQSSGGDYSHRIVALTSDGDMRHRYAEAGIDVIALDFSKAPIRGFFRLVRLIKHSRPDIVQTWMYHADLFGGIAARIAGCRRILWGIRTSEVGDLSSRSTSIIRKVCALLSRWVPRRIICAADASRRSHESIGYDAKKMVVIPNGVELEQWQATGEAGPCLRRQLGIPDEAFVIGSVGRFNAVKDQHTFVAAAGRVLQNDASIWFLMVGRDVSTENRELMSWLEQAGISKQTRMLGERRDLSVCYAAMDLFCMHSRSEGFPNAVAEAMASRVPCVATDVGDARLLLDGCGAIVPAGNPEALADALIAVKRQGRAERKHIASTAFERIQQRYSMEACRARFESLYVQLMSLEH